MASPSRVRLTPPAPVDVRDETNALTDTLLVDDTSRGQERARTRVDDVQNTPPTISSTNTHSRNLLSPRTANAPTTTVGLVLSGQVIDYIVEGGSAHEDGQLQVGDVITHVDSLPVNESMVSARVRGEIGSKVNVRVERADGIFNNKTVNVVLERRRLWSAAEERDRVEVRTPMAHARAVVDLAKSEGLQRSVERLTAELASKAQECEAHIAARHAVESENELLQSQYSAARDECNAWRSEAEELRGQVERLEFQLSRYQQRHVRPEDSQQEEASVSEGGGSSRMQSDRDEGDDNNVRPSASSAANTDIDDVDAGLLSPLDQSSPSRGNDDQDFIGRDDGRTLSTEVAQLGMPISILESRKELLSPRARGIDAERMITSLTAQLQDAIARDRARRADIEVKTQAWKLERDALMEALDAATERERAAAESVQATIAGLEEESSLWQTRAREARMQAQTVVETSSELQAEVAELRSQLAAAANIQARSSVSSVHDVVVGGDGGRGSSLGVGDTGVPISNVSSGRFSPNHIIGERSSLTAMNGSQRGVAAAVQPIQDELTKAHAAIAQLQRDLTAAQQDNDQFRHTVADLTAMQSTVARMRQELDNARDEAARGEAHRVRCEQLSLEVSQLQGRYVIARDEAAKGEAHRVRCEQLSLEVSQLQGRYVIASDEAKRLQGELDDAIPVIADCKNDILRLRAERDSALSGHSNQNVELLRAIARANEAEAVAQQAIEDRQAAIEEAGRRQSSIANSSIARLQETELQLEEQRRVNEEDRARYKAEHEAAVLALQSKSSVTQERVGQLLRQNEVLMEELTDARRMCAENDNAQNDLRDGLGKVSALQDALSASQQKCVQLEITADGLRQQCVQHETAVNDLRQQLQRSKCELGIKTAALGASEREVSVHLAAKDAAEARAHRVVDSFHNTQLSTLITDLSMSNTNSRRVERSPSRDSSQSHRAPLRMQQDQEFQAYRNSQSHSSQSPKLPSMGTTDTATQPRSPASTPRAGANVSDTEFREHSTELSTSVLESPVTAWVSPHARRIAAAAAVARGIPGAGVSPTLREEMLAVPRNRDGNGGESRRKSHGTPESISQQGLTLA